MENNKRSKTNLGSDTLESLVLTRDSGLKLPLPVSSSTNFPRNLRSSLLLEQKFSQADKKTQNKFIRKLIHQTTGFTKSRNHHFALRIIDKERAPFDKLNHPISLRNNMSDTSLSSDTEAEHRGPKVKGEIKNPRHGFPLRLKSDEDIQYDEIEELESDNEFGAKFDTALITLNTFCRADNPNLVGDPSFISGKAAVLWPDRISEYNSKREKRMAIKEASGNFLKGQNTKIRNLNDREVMALKEDFRSNREKEMDGSCSESDPEMSEYINELARRKKRRENRTREVIYYDESLGRIRNLHRSSISLTSYYKTDANLFGKSNRLHAIMTPEELKMVGFEDPNEPKDVPKESGEMIEIKEGEIPEEPGKSDDKIAAPFSANEKGDTGDLKFS